MGDVLWSLFLQSKIGGKYTTHLCLITSIIQSFKLIHRWYTVPLQWNLINKSIVMLAKLWSTEKLYTLLVRMSLNQTTPAKKNPSTNKTNNGLWIMYPWVYFNYRKERPITFHKQKSIMILLRVTRLEIASNWKGKTLLSVSSWHTKLWEHYLMGKLADKIQIRLIYFIVHWNLISNSRISNKHKYTPPKLKELNLHVY